MSFPRAEIFEAAGIKMKAFGVAGGTGRIRDVNDFLKRLSGIAKKHKVVAQAFDGRTVAGTKHLVHAARLAAKAQESGKGLASTLEVELVCWVAAERQIARAIGKVGLKNGEQNVAILVIGDSNAAVKRAMNETLSSLDLKDAPGVLSLGREKEKRIKEIFSITSKELESTPLVNLVLERVSMLELQR